jgi:hypothetical protein
MVSRCSDPHRRNGASRPGVGSSMRLSASFIGAVSGLLLLAGCTVATDRTDPTARSVPVEDAAPGTGQGEPPPAEYPDRAVRRLNLMAAERRPVEPSAMPPRHLDEETFPVSLVERTRIVSGGPPPDGIPAIDDPAFERAAEVEWLSDDEAVLSLEVDGVARAYPARVMTWHEIVNDVLAGVPVAVTYCPLCNSAVAFERRLEGRTFDFGTSGALYLSALVMYDRQTETLWTHFDGRAVVGTLAGAELERLPVATVSWREFREANPDAEVLSRDTGHDRPYGRNRYVAYDQSDAPLTGFFTGDIDVREQAMQRVVGIYGDERDLAISTDRLREAGTVDTELDGRPITIWYEPGLASPLQKEAIDGGDDIGATGVFLTDSLADPGTFEQTAEGFVDDASGSTWNIFGRAVDGPLAGHQLQRVEHLDTFWFAWSSYRPDTDLLDRNG